MRYKPSIPLSLLVVLLLGATVFQQHNTGDIHRAKTAEFNALPTCIDPPKCQKQAKLKVDFLINKIQIEEEIYANLTFEPGWKLKNAWIEGLNMYMGKNNAIIESLTIEKGEGTIVFFLGSCNQPTMHWQLKTEWVNSQDQTNSHHSVIADFNFYTER